jgi:UDP-N-acetylglucosamine--N-acetylmuramyl-(pentapeptide) pyrophosphoryl-undecaprenol N-acetylglucosamine transferase
VNVLKVYIAPCGIGLGHVTRSATIASNLNKRGIDTVFSTYLDGINYVQKMGFKLREGLPISFKVKKDGTVDFIQTVTRSGFSIGLHKFLKQLVREIQNIENYDPDVVFSDTRLSTIIAAKLLKKPIILMLNQFRIDIIKGSGRDQKISEKIFFLIANFFWIFIRDLISWIWTWSDWVLVPDYPPPYTISIKNLYIPNRYSSKVKLIGSIVSTKNKELPDKSVIRFEFDLDPKKPVVYAAISGPKVERLYLIDRLSKILSSLSTNYQIIISKGDPSSHRLPIIKEKLHIFDWIDDLKQFKLIKVSDVIISRAGHGIITKVLAYGKPLILIPIPNQTEQYGNATRAEKLGVAKIIEQDFLSKETLQNSIDEILNEEKFKKNFIKMDKITQSLDGVEIATDLIIHMAYISDNKKSPISKCV